MHVAPKADDSYIPPSIATTNSELRDLVLQTVGVRPSATQTDNMVFICTDNRLAYDRLCATGDCILWAASGDVGAVPFLSLEFGPVG